MLRLTRLINQGFVIKSGSEYGKLDFAGEYDGMARIILNGEGCSAQLNHWILFCGMKFKVYKDEGVSAVFLFDAPREIEITRDEVFIRDFIRR